MASDMNGSLNQCVQARPDYACCEFLRQRSGAAARSVRRRLLPMTSPRVVLAVIGSLAFSGCMMHTVVGGLRVPSPDDNYVLGSEAPYFSDA
jgi:hypothetical protein